MNVFEELVEELKGEDLLELTVTEIPIALAPAAAGNGAKPAVAPITERHAERGTVSGFAPVESVPHVENEAEYFRKRAVEQVSGLQMVEHVLSGIEREYMKVVPASFNDLKVKQALHTFIKINSEPDSPEHLEAEGLLIYETDAWTKALAQRDGQISVANVRRFCENSRPVLSSQALIALARFYRTSPASEPVRGKFDFVMTRLFSRDAGDDKRKLLFGTLEMIRHIGELYENWANLVPFEARTPDSTVAETLVKLRQAIEESETADSFDELVRSDFFNRTRAVKESAGEMFFVPEVTAAAVECNVRIGNRFVDLLNAEKANYSIEVLEEKYGYNYDSVISGAASKTVMLAELVRHEPEIEVEEPTANVPVIAEPPKPAAKAPVVHESFSMSERRSTVFGINKWLLALSILALAITLSIYLWSEGNTNQEAKVVVADAVNLADSGLTDHLKMARSSSETLYGVVEPNWDAMTEQQQQEFLKKAQDFATSKGLKKVNLVNAKGRTVAYAAGQRSEIVKQ